MAARTWFPWSRRCLEGLVVVGLWMALGWAVGLGANEYLLLGIPITIAFQWAIRRESLLGLWVRESPPFSLRLAWLGVAALVSLPLIVPFALDLYERSGNWRALGWGVSLWYLSGVGGAVGVAYSLRHFRRTDVRPLMHCLLVTGLFGTLLTLFPWLATQAESRATVWQRIGIGIVSFLQYVPICFALEEVFFRGALDAHVYHPGETGRWPTALFVSTLWGLWHLPTIPLSTVREAGGVIVFSLVFVHCLVGVPLSFFWRSSGNLLVPAVSHALVDAIRNALLYAPG